MITTASSSRRRDQRYLRCALETMHYKFPEMIDLDCSSVILWCDRSYVRMTRAVHPLLVYIITAGRTGRNNRVVDALSNRLIEDVLIDVKCHYDMGVKLTH